jgi:hypothetical protein
MSVAFNYNFQSHNFDSPGYITCYVPECVRNELEKTIEDIKNNRKNYKDLRKKLAGHLEQEYEMPITPNISYLAETLAIEYDKLFNGGAPSMISRSQYHCNTDDDLRFKYELKTLWINFAKKYDFNPIHSHSGLFSFVIWVEIPYDLKEELSRYSPNGCETTLFGFSYINSLGKLCKKKSKYR